MAEQLWATLMTQAQQGSHSAYAELLHQLCPYLRNFLRPRLSQPDLIEDVVQEILLALHTASHTWYPHEPFLPWLHGIVRYKLVDALRASYRKNAYETVDSDLLVTLSVAGPNREEETTPMDLERILATLTPRQRQVVRLTQLEGHTAQEAGQLLGMSTGAVKVALHRILQCLKQQFGTRT